MIKVVLHKIIYWSIILITILRASSLFSQVPVISIPQPAEIGRFDNFRQTSPQKPSGISSSRDALIQRQNEAIMREVKENERRRAAINRQYAIQKYMKSNSTNLRFRAILSAIVMSWSVRSMIRILFLCHGNICRSPMAEFIMKDLVKKASLEQSIQIESAATSTEEIGNPVYPPARRKLSEHGIDCSGKRARQLLNSDYEKYDLLIGMDRANLRSMYRICGGDFADKMHLLMDFTHRPGEVADPWYTDDFDTTWRDVEEGCRGLLHHIQLQSAIHGGDF